jgi:hypothetical protein
VRKRILKRKRKNKDKELSVLIRSVKVSEYEKGRNRDEW